MKRNRTFDPQPPRAGAGARGRLRWRLVLPALAALVVAGCGFHLRGAVSLPPSLSTLAVDVAGGGTLARELTLDLRAAGVNVVGADQAGAARLRVPVARFQTRALTVNGYARVREYSVTYHVEFNAIDANGASVLAPQTLEMSREFTYDRAQALGTATREEQIRESLVGDMARAILRRLQLGAKPASD